MRTVWCVRTDVDGRFRYAKPARDGHEVGLIVWSTSQWHDVDPEAAEQYLVPDDSRRALQLAFCEATGLDRAPQIRAAMCDALDRR